MSPYISLIPSTKTVVFLGAKFRVNTVLQDYMPEAETGSAATGTGQDTILSAGFVTFVFFIRTCLKMSLMLVVCVRMVIRWRHKY